MLPTLNYSGDVLLIEHLSHRLGKVPKGHVWIQGDNVYASADSRYFGPVPYGLIQGRAFLRVWPIQDFGFLG
ncbi:Mitochondrial inner membrane protease subunit 1 [Linum perenne]